MKRAAAWIAALTSIAAAPGHAVTPATPAPREAVTSTQQFAFYSDVDFNLYDALLEAAAARTDQRREGVHGEAAACFDQLPKAQRSAWNQAVDYFAANVASTWTFSAERYSFRAHFAHLPPIDREGDDGSTLELGRLFHQAASAAYRACRWPAQDRANRDWIAALVPRLERHGNAIATILEGRYGAQWRAWPIPVDVVETAGQYGADTVGGPRTHIQISSRNPGYQGLAALEMIFHEASHELVGPRYQPLADASRATGRPVPGDLWHALLFFTAGEVTRRELEAAGIDYVPYTQAQNMFEGRWRPFLEPLRKAWLPFVHGQGERDDAARALLEALADGDR